jgi:hypothetical protein
VLERDDEKMKVALIVFCMLGVLFLSADNKALKEQLKNSRENPDE